MHSPVMNRYHPSIPKAALPPTMPIRSSWESDASGKGGPRQPCIVNGRSVPFPLRLLQMIRKEAIMNPSVVRWSDDGNVFFVDDEKSFINDTLPRYGFKASKMQSFQRNLNIYGFTRLSKGPFSSGYVHPEFGRYIDDSNVTNIKREYGGKEGGGMKRRMGYYWGSTESMNGMGGPFAQASFQQQRRISSDGSLSSTSPSIGGPSFAQPPFPQQRCDSSDSSLSSSSPSCSSFSTTTFQTSPTRGPALITQEHRLEPRPFNKEDQDLAELVVGHSGFWCLPVESLNTEKRKAISTIRAPQDMSDRIFDRLFVKRRCFV